MIKFYSNIFNFESCVNILFFFFWASYFIPFYTFIVMDVQILLAICSELFFHSSISENNSYLCMFDRKILLRYREWLDEILSWKKKVITLNRDLELQTLINKTDVLISIFLLVSCNDFSWWQTFSNVLMSYKICTIRFFSRIFAIVNQNHFFY